ncbi:glycosyltransferase [Ramlibacter alkalitolerans]|uniref:Glycosyltransferase family 4 protein n=1 Tax=Ramlibacter alkalitolerans TaxID=2039631 RepID=A0ABS1JWS6_9BURK|nr:glycosyltransferase family 4 protein [Ramlibacter alkalitolerans]
MATKKLLIVTDVVFVPANEGNKKRILDLVCLYQSLGVEVHVLLVVNKRRNDLSELEELVCGRVSTCSRGGLDRLRVGVGRAFRFASAKLQLNARRNYELDEWYCTSLDAAIFRLQEQFDFDYLQVEYLYFSRALLASGPRLKLLDAHDVFTDRWAIFPKGERPNVWYSVSRSDEARGCGRSDCVIAISGPDANHFRSLGAQPTLLLDFIAPPKPTSYSVAGAFVFLGSGNRMNRSGLDWMIQKVLPKVLQQEPGFKLRVAGSICNSTAPAEGVELLGVVDIDALFADASMMLNPVSIGSGLPIKNIDALSRGVPILCTPNAARGAECFIGTGVLIAEDESQFAGEVVSLLRDPARRADLSRRATAAYAAQYTAARERLKFVLDL